MQMEVRRQIDGCICSDCWRMADNSKIYFDYYEKDVPMVSSKSSAGKWTKEYMDQVGYNDHTDQIMNGIMESIDNGNILKITMHGNAHVTISFFMTNSTTYGMLVQSSEEAYQQDLENETNPSERYKETYPSERLPRAPFYQSLKAD